MKGDSTTTTAAGSLKKVSVVSESPNVSRVISQNVSEVVKSTVLKVDRQSEVRKCISTNRSK